MVRIPADMREHRWFNPHTRGATTFRPHGKLHVVGQELVRNPRAWITKKPTLAARLFVRLQVGDARRWSLDDLIAGVIEIRTAQGQAPDVSFIVREGAVSDCHAGKCVELDGAQIVVVNARSLPRRKFVAEVERLAEVLAARLGQDEIVVQFQRDGLPVETCGITAAVGRPVTG